MSNNYILWDFDGTLGFREGMWSGTLVEILLEHHPETTATRDDFRPHLKAGFPWHDHDRDHLHLTTAEQWWEALEPLFANAYQQVGLPEQRARELARHVRTQYVKHDRWQLFDDVIPTLETLSAQGFKHVIVSNHVPELEDLIAKLGLAPHLHAVINSAVVGYEKPHPEIYRFAQKELGHPSVLWMIGDNIEADVHGAERVGIPAILVRKQHEDAPRQCEGIADVIQYLKI